jgi:hypothetical protein
MERNEEHSWEETKKVGDEFEEFSANDIRIKKYPQAYVDDRGKKFDWWDIYVNETIKIECKNDKKGFTTENICIEVGCDGKPSGLKVTEAEYWLISGGVKTFLIKTTELKKLIKEEYHDKLKRAEMDDNYVFDLNGIQYQLKYPVDQGNGITKYMDWYLIPQEFFTKFCLEVGVGDKMTYDKLI